MRDFLNVLKQRFNEANENLGKMSMKDKINMASGMAMGATTAPVSKIPPIKLNLISNADRDIMGEFVNMVENNSRQAMGSVGQNAQRILEGFRGNPAMSNKTLANFFNALLQRTDELGIRPVEEPFLKKINLK